MQEKRKENNSNMHGHKKQASEYIVMGIGNDAGNSIRNTTRKYSHASEKIKRNQRHNQNANREVEYIDSSRTVRPTHNVYLSEESRLMSRNGLTPRLEDLQPPIEKNVIIEKQYIGDSTDHDKHKTELSPMPIYSCNFCGVRFNIKSLIDAHRRTHDDDFKARYFPKRPCAALLPQVKDNQCKFCDRKFDLERTLHIHQLCHCKKIPPAQHRKLGYTELLHEKKAPLPIFHKHSHSVARA